MPRKPLNKSQIAGKIVARMLARKNVPAPKTIKAELESKLECSTRMASTYYYNITSPNGRWNPANQAES